MKRLGSSKKNDIGSDIKDAVVGVAGGIVANQVSTALEKSSVLGANSSIAPMAVAALALAGYLFAPKGSMIKNAAYGALIVSGTEQAENLTSGLMAGDFTLGFTPQMIPTEFDESVTMVNGIPVH
jgi:hypothetical protein